MDDQLIEILSTLGAECVALAWFYVVTTQAMKAVFLAGCLYFMVKLALYIGEE